MAHLEVQNCKSPEYIDRPYCFMHTPAAWLRLWKNSRAVILKDTKLGPQVVSAKPTTNRKKKKKTLEEFYKEMCY